jgi:tetratricopeptide (TPR) repeat protein
MRAKPQKVSEPFKTLKRPAASSAADLEAHAGVLRQERDAAVSAGHIFDAMLANIAAMLSTGDESEATVWIAAHHEQINANADAQALLRSLKPTDAASARAAADTLGKMAQFAGPHGYVLNIFEANTRQGLHQGDRAIQLFLAALAADPAITGAWVDLGTIYYGDFRADAAWACWDAARSLRPTHYMLGKVDDLERKLRTDHPEFF